MGDDVHMFWIFIFFNPYDFICYPEVVKEPFIISFLNLTVEEPLTRAETLIYIYTFPPRVFSLALTFSELLSVSRDNSLQFPSVLLQTHSKCISFSFFLLFKTSSASFLLANLTIIFVVLPSLWQTTIMRFLIDIPIFSNIFITVSSKFFIVMF